MMKCAKCGEELQETVLEHYERWSKETGLIIFINVPARECVECGEVYFDAATSRKMEDAIAGEIESEERLSVPVYRLGENTAEGETEGKALLRELGKGLGDGPRDLASAHDKYLYGEKEKASEAIMNVPGEGFDVSYDSEQDILYIAKSGEEEGFVEIAPGIHVELDGDGKVMGVEIFNASQVLKGVMGRLGGKVEGAVGRGKELDAVQEVREWRRQVMERWKGKSWEEIQEELNECGERFRKRMEEKHCGEKEEA